MEQHQSWDTIYLNLAKAFNKVEHKEFLKKTSYGNLGHFGPIPVRSGCFCPVRFGGESF